MSNDDSPGDSLKEIEAFLSGEDSAAPDKVPEPGFDDMLRSALDTATTEAPAVEDNDAWLDAINVPLERHVDDEKRDYDAAVTAAPPRRRRSTST